MYHANQLLELCEQNPSVVEDLLDDGVLFLLARFDDIQIDDDAITVIHRLKECGNIRGTVVFHVYKKGIRQGVLEQFYKGKPVMLLGGDYHRYSEKILWIEGCNLFIPKSAAEFFNTFTSVITDYNTRVRARGTGTLLKIANDGSLSLGDDRLPTGAFRDNNTQPQKGGSTVGGFFTLIGLALVIIVIFRACTG